MDATGWAAVSAAVSALGSLVSAVVALSISRFTAEAAATQTKVLDFNNCIEVVKQLGEAQRRVRDAKDDEAVRTFELRELLNLLEALALLINDGKLAPSTRRFTCPFIEEAWAWLKTDPGMAELFNEAITSNETFMELKIYAKENPTRINKLIESYELKFQRLNSKGQGGPKQGEASPPGAAAQAHAGP